MEYIQIKSIEDPLFSAMFRLLQEIFPAEEVLDFDLWREPLQDPQIRLFAAVHEGETVGATEYRYYEDDNVAMTDFTIIGKEGLGIGRFLAQKRAEDLARIAAAVGRKPIGMFAEIYNPYRVQDHSFGGIKPMDPFVRREVLSHLGYRRLDFAYVHPSWQNNGDAVSGLDLCFLSFEHEGNTLPAEFIVRFLKRYYAVLPNKSAAWHEMIAGLETVDTVELLPI
jgi:hypothetical protein